MTKRPWRVEGREGEGLPWKTLSTFSTYAKAQTNADWSSQSLVGIELRVVKHEHGAGEDTP